MNSHKTIIGVGSAGIIEGKGLRLANGVSNIIIQNIRITNLNPQYIWGGDALTLDGADMVWIDHCKTDLIGRQHLVLGYNANARVTFSNNEIDGITPWSSTCDGRHYWAALLLGSSDLVTMKGNYVHHTSGRSPKVGGNTLLHAVNNYFYSNSGHAFDAIAGAQIVAEGNVFQNVVTPLLDPVEGQIYTSSSASYNTLCASYLGHDCQANAMGSSGSFDVLDTGFFSDFSGKNIASAASASGVASSVSANAGVGKI